MVNVAVTVLFASIVTIHIPVPEHAPPHPVKVDVYIFHLDMEGFGVRVTTVPAANDCDVPVMPERVHDPVPDRDTVRVYRVGGIRVKVAVTVFAILAMTTQIFPDVVLHPVQLVNVNPAAGDAVRVTTVPRLYNSVQSVSQEIPAGREEMVPVPIFRAVSIYVGTELNVAVTVLFISILIPHVFPDVVLHPVHLVKVDPVTGRAVRVTEVPILYDSVQSVPQVTPVGREEIVPIPIFCVISVYFGRAVNIAVTVVSELRAIVHMSTPVHAPPHHVKVDHATGDAVRVTREPLG